MATAYKQAAAAAAAAASALKQPPSPASQSAPATAAAVVASATNTRNRFLYGVLAFWGVGCVIVTLVMCAKAATHELPDSVPWSLSARWLYSTVISLLLDCFVLQPLVIVSMMLSGCGLRVLYQ
jgi:hypothetical protein